VRKTDYFVV